MGRAVICVALLVGATCLAEEVRTWTSSKNGRQFKGALVGVEEDSVSIRRESDQVVFKVKKALSTPFLDFSAISAML